MTERKNTRNFAILAHIDHGKSTLADRFLEMTGTVEKRKMKEQILDSMDLERERGITIKLQPATMRYVYKNQKSETRNPKQIQNSKYQISNKLQNLNDQNSKQKKSLENSNLEFNNCLGFRDSNLEFSDSEFILNLIDTPGHVDFGYEVSRSLAAVEGAVLLVDATKGVQAQTLANLYQAVELGLEIIPVVNKIDLPNAQVEKTRNEILSILGPTGNNENPLNSPLRKGETGGFYDDGIILASGKTGEGADKILQAIVERIPAPKSPLAEEYAKSQEQRKKNHNSRPKAEQPLAEKSEVPLRALVFDSKYDPYKGVLAYVRIVDGKVSKDDELFFMVNKVKADALEVGKFRPQLTSCDVLETGQIGYIATGLKSVEECRVGDTITLAGNNKFQTTNYKQIPNNKLQKINKENIVLSATSYKPQSDLQPLPGYKEVRPMVYASFYPQEGEDYNQMRDALEKLKLNDAALTFEGESSLALGRGFRLGFLGLLHLEIIQERLKREFGFKPVITTPSVVYEVLKSSGDAVKIYSASEMPDASHIKEIREPYAKLEILTPSQYLGDVMKLVSETTRSQYISTDYIDKDRVSLRFDSPLSEIIVNFHDSLKSVSKGFASMNYELSDYKAYDLVKMDIYVAEEKVDAFAQIIPRERTFSEGRKIVKKLKEVIPRQNFMIKLQAAIGGKVIARESISAFRKDVTGHLYGGDITRKRKLLEKQKKGKKRMTASGRAHIPQEAFLKILKK